MAAHESVPQDALNEVLRAGDGFDAPSVTLGRPLTPDLRGSLDEHVVRIPLGSLNRHGLVAGRESSRPS